MRKSKTLLETTSSSREYKSARIKHQNEKAGRCTICPKNRGCNRYSSRRVNRSWKEYRGTQWK